MIGLTPPQQYILPWVVVGLIYCYVLLGGKL